MVLILKILLYALSISNYVTSYDQIALNDVISDPETVWGD
jgi:hypothetical protein